MTARDLPIADTFSCTCAGPMSNVTVDGNHGHSYSCDVWTNPPKHPEAPVDLWSEDGDRLWLRHDLADRAATAKRIAYLGRNRDRSVSLPAGFGEGRWIKYAELYVRAVYCRPGEPDESGWAGSGEDTWHACAPEHPKAVAYWEVGV